MTAAQSGRMALNKVRTASIASKVLAAFFLTVGVVKLLSGYRSQFDINPVIYHLLSVLEVVVGLLVLVRPDRVGGGIALALSMGIVGTALLLPDINCGCLGGAVAVTFAHRLIAGSVAGLLSCIVFSCGPSVPNK